MPLNVKGIQDAELLKEKFKDFIYSLSLTVLLPPSRCLFGVACTWQMRQHKLYNVNLQFPYCTEPITTWTSHVNAGDDYL